MNHYEERLERDLSVIRARVAALGGRLDTALANAVRAFLQRDRDLAAATILGDRPVNRATREIDHLCHAFVARHLPSAGHLRYISAVLRMSIALERIGDYAVSISREAVQSRSPTPPTVGRDIEMMAEQSRGVLRQSLKAFDEQNSELARGTMAMESQSNAVYRKVYRDLVAEGESRSPTPPTVGRDIEMMAEQSRGVLRQALKAFDEQNSELARGTMVMESQSNTVYRKVYRDLLAEGESRSLPVRDLFAFLVILGRLERISDQAKNVCEETVFSATGETKGTSPFRILFVDARNTGPSVLALAIAQKAFPKSGRYESGGWEPAQALDPGLVQFMDGHGHDVRGYVPVRADTAYESLRKHDVVVVLSPGVRERFPEIPYSTVVLDWSADVAGAGPAGSLEDPHREELYKRLAARIRDLMETLCGEQAS